MIRKYILIAIENEKTIESKMFVRFEGYLSSKTDENVTQTIECCGSKGISCEQCGGYAYYDLIKYCIST